ncbi:MAG: hypothetical protein ACFCU7_01610 [Pleurocapsa sp.]
MKIAISELESPATLLDVNSTQGGAIVGGATEVVVYTAANAVGDFAVTRSDANVYNFEYKTKRGVYSGSFGFGYALAFSFEGYK